jgi:glycosyltransferase involved in cell wall biosynthesis
MTEQPAISVIVPAHNEAAHIAEQLEALGRQTFDGPWEIIVVDHNSTDDTPDIVRDWQGRLPNLRLERAPLARNAAGVRNRGAELARAELLAFCDGDDVVADGWLGAMVERLGRDDLVVGPRDLTRLNPPGSFAYIPFGDRLQHQDVYGGYTFVYGGNCGVRRDAYLVIDGMDETVGHKEDADFGIRFVDAGHTVGYAPDALVHQRLRTGSRALFRQHFGEGYGTVLLYTRYRSRARRRPVRLRLVAREYGFLVVRAYWLLDWSKRRHWLVVAGRRAGQLSASVRYRVFCP